MQLRSPGPRDEVSADAMLCAEPAHPYVSRGGVKLAAALDHFGFDPRGRVCLDVRASTGGLSESLLQRGARRVYPLDVGRDQLHLSLRLQLDLVPLEGPDVRARDPLQLPGPP